MNDPGGKRHGSFNSRRRASGSHLSARTSESSQSWYTRTSADAGSNPSGMSPFFVNTVADSSRVGLRSQPPPIDESHLTFQTFVLRSFFPPPGNSALGAYLPFTTSERK